MNDLVSEYQQYQDATAEDEEEMDEEEMEWTRFARVLLPNCRYNKPPKAQKIFKSTQLLISNIYSKS
jgi:hypothetical protein